MDITSHIFEAIDLVNEQIIDGPKIVKSSETVLLGSNSTIDSLSLVNLIVAVEDIISQKLDKQVSLIDEDLLSSEDQPLKTVASFAAFIGNKV